MSYKAKKVLFQFGITTIKILIYTEIEKIKAILQVMKCNIKDICADIAENLNDENITDYDIEHLIQKAKKIRKKSILNFFKTIKNSKKIK